MKTQDTPKHYKFTELETLVWKYNYAHKVNTSTDHTLQMVLVFTRESFPNQQFTETERSYQVGNANNRWIEGLISNALWGDCLDGKDVGVRLDYYLNEWTIEYAYFLTPEDEERALATKDVKTPWSC